MQGYFVDFLIKICQNSAVGSLLGFGVLLSGFFGGCLFDDLLDSFLNMLDGLLGVSLSQDLLEDVDSLFGAHGLDHVSDGPLGSVGRLEGVGSHGPVVNNSGGPSFEDMSDLVVDGFVSPEEVVHGSKAGSCEAVSVHNGEHLPDLGGVVSLSIVDDSVEVMDKSLMDDQLLHVTSVHLHMTF